MNTKQEVVNGLRLDRKRLTDDTTSENVLDAEFQKLSEIDGITVTVNNEFEKLVPPLTESEFGELENSILADGCLNPIVMWKGSNILVDGHHRHAICNKHGIEPRVVEIDLADRDAARAWIIRHQLGRRNLTPFQKVELALQMEPSIRKTAKENQIAGGKSKNQLCQISDEAIKPVDTKKELAKIAGVSHDTIARAKKIHESGSEGAKDKLRRGDTTINREYKRITQAERKAGQLAAVAEARLPDGKYHVIAVDPPWRYDKRPDDPSHRGALPYPSMTIEEIKALDVAGLAHDDCILWLWTTNSHMVEAHEVAGAWGFSVKTILTWVKDRMGLGDWLRGKTEHCLMCVRGKPVVNLTNQTTVLNGKVREHSRKPEEFYKLVQSICIGSKAELFSRERRDGWQSHGAELEQFSPDANDADSTEAPAA